ncbi:MAG: GNAT family N-acetyltransferase [Anaerolineales bacterium]|nr:GNAT family N-acetyltransferase [Anaerolineales bacterium]
MTAATMSSSRQSCAGLRPMNPRTDLGEVADLIEATFDISADPEGGRMIRDMRAFSRAGFFGWIMSYLLLTPSSYPRGFVWEESGKVVGNASLLRVEGFPRRWVLANVAVHPEYRRRGIGRELINASLDHVNRQGGEELLLQVESDNQTAQVIYASLGMRPLGTYTSWVRTRGTSLSPFNDTGSIRFRQQGEWKAQWELAKRLQPKGLIWPYPLSQSLFHQPFWVRLAGQENRNHLVLVEEGEMMGSLTLRYNQSRTTCRLVMLVAPEVQGEVESSLLNAALVTTGSNTKVLMDYPAGTAVETIKDLGFIARRSLTWMYLNFRISKEFG